MLPAALAAMKSGGCSSARMIIAAPPAVGNAAISEPRNGPLRSTTTEAATTMPEVSTILNRRPSKKTSMRSSHLQSGAPREQHQETPADRDGERERKPGPFAERLGRVMERDA